MKQLLSFLLIALLAAGVLLIGCSEDDENPAGINGSYGTISGTVNGIIEIEPDTTGTDTTTVDSIIVITEALVQIDGTIISTYTDSTGAYSLESPVGVVTLTVYKDDYADGKAIDTVTAGEITTVNFNIVPGEGSIPNQPIVGMWMLTGMAVDGNNLPDDGFLVITLSFRIDGRLCTGTLAYRDYSEEFRWSLSGNSLSLQGNNLANMDGIVSGYNVTFEKSEGGHVVTQVFTKQHSGMDVNLDQRLVRKWELTEVALNDIDEPFDTLMQWDIELFNNGIGEMTLEGFTERFSWSTRDDMLFMSGEVYNYSIFGDTLSGDSLTGYEINWHSLELEGVSYGKHYYYSFAVWEEDEEEEADTTEGFIDDDLIGTWSLIGRRFNFIEIPIDTLIEIGFYLHADSTGASFVDDSTRSLTWSVNETHSRVYFTYSGEIKDAFFYEVTTTDTATTVNMEYMKNSIFYIDTYLKE
ncbi:MAG: carboxypeptidase regulatory-like domain-containing protein [Calditrichaeota bacterium]|nr:carboxypeptidase regulatory-like domain-containing protein [Calditrichota bacterium]